MSTARKYDDVELPDGWRTVRLDAIADAFMGQSPPGEAVVTLDGKFEESDWTAIHSLHRSKGMPNLVGRTQLHQNGVSIL